jgi:transcription termination factor Rho
MSVLERAKLEDSTLSDLHAIASELSLDGYRRLRKAQLIDALLEHQSGDAPAEDSEPKGESDEESSGSSRRRRGRRGGRTRSGDSPRPATGIDPFDDGVETEEEAAERTSRSRQSQSTGKGRSGRGGRAAKDGKDSRDAKAAGNGKESKDAEPVIVSGVVELLPGGSGFLRVNGPEPSDDDVYISAAQVKRCELVAGDTVSGPRRPPHRSERFPSLVRIDTVNEKPADEISERTRFEDLPAEFPTERFKLGTRDQTLKAIEPLAPFGRGSRVIITGGPWAGKSHLLKLLAGVFAKEKTVTAFSALAGVRPEELGEWADGPVVPVATAPLGSSSDAQDHAVELVVEQAKRLVARGENAVVLIDSLDGLHELTARKVLASARNVKDGGSLTVIATASETFGGETTVIALDENLTRAGNLPAVKFPETGTLRAELLVGDKGSKAIQKAIAGATK